MRFRHCGRSQSGSASSITALLSGGPRLMGARTAAYGSSGESGRRPVRKRKASVSAFRAFHTSDRMANPLYGLYGKNREWVARHLAYMPHRFSQIRVLHELWGRPIIYAVASVMG